MVAKKETESTELVRQEVTEAAAGIVQREGDIFGQLVRTEQLTENEGAEAVYKTILMEIMRSETVDDVLTVIEAVSLKELIGTKLRIYGFNFNESEFDQGSPLYASIRAEVLDTGEHIIANTGWQGAMMQLYRIHQLDGFPFDAVPVTPRKPNKYGNYPIKFQKAADYRG